MSNDPQYLIVGSDGSIGSALLRNLPPGEALGTSRRTPAPENQIFLDCGGDLRDWPIPDGVQVVINCAAVARLEACKRDPQGSRRVNVESVVTLAEKCAEAGVFFIHLSTDKVFSGQRPRMPVDAPFAPTTEYGRQKADAERPLLSMLSAGAPLLAIIRLTKVLPPGMALLRSWRESLEAGQVIRPFADMTLAPVSLPFVVQMITLVAERKCSGLFQLSGDRDISYAELAGELAKYLSADSELVQPVEAAKTNLYEETIPPYTSLDTSQTTAVLGVSIPDTMATVSWAFSTL